MPCCGLTTHKILCGQSVVSPAQSFAKLLNHFHSLMSTTYCCVHTVQKSASSTETGQFSVSVYSSLSNRDLSDDQHFSKRPAGKPAIDQCLQPIAVSTDYCILGGWLSKYNSAAGRHQHCLCWYSDLSGFFFRLS